MTINALGNSLSTAQRVLQTRTPDANFFDAFKTAYGQFESTRHPQPAAETSTSVSISPLAQALGQTHMEMASRRGINTQDEEAFAGILNRAYSSGGMEDPAAFLKTLSREDLGVIQRVHSLGAEINPAGLGKESAYNLLLPDGYSVDFNHDGMEDMGEGRGIHFPPRDAPQAVVDAWNTATQGMDEIDLLSYSMVMHGYIHGISIGDGPATGGMDSSNIDSYRAAVGNYLDMLERLRGQLPAGQYENDQPFFDKLRTLLG
ncbi:MAG: hypothetical protein Q7U91_00160 [Sideroxyarcus sp.]|nr:hypothetical protein [Sideroxyarcus sp.]